MNFTNSDFIFDGSINAKDKTAFCRKWLYSWEKQNLPGLQNADYSQSKWINQVTLLIHSFQPDEAMFYVNEFPILHTWKILGRLPVVIITDKETRAMAALRERYPEDVSVRISPAICPA